jgi:HK97 family phage major capsid protein
MSHELEDVLDHLSSQLEHLEDNDPRSGRRFVGQGADESYVEHIANGGTSRTIPPTFGATTTSATKGVVSAMLESKALAESTGSAGGHLVGIEVSGEVLRLLRARSAVMRLGPTVVPVKKELDVVALSTGAVASYVQENARVPVTEQTFATSVLLRPKALAALVPVSNRLLRDARENPSVESIVRSDLTEVLALRADLAFLRGTGTGDEPLGIRNVVGTTPAPSLGANGGQPTYDNLMDLVGALRLANAPFRKPGWIFNPRTLNGLAKLKDSTGRYLAEAGLLTYDATGGGGMLLNFPFVSSTQIPANLTTGSSTDTSEVYFSSDWDEAWIGENETLEIAVSTEATYSADGSTWNSAFQQAQTLFRCMWTHDFALRRPQLFSVMTGVR